MAFVTRFTIQRLSDRYGTEYYLLPDQWSEDEADAEEFFTSAKARRRADRVGGEVCVYERPATECEAYRETLLAEIKARLAARRSPILEAAE